MIKRFLRKGILSLGMFLGLMLVLASCDTAYRTNYLRDLEEAKIYTTKHDKGIVVQKGDKLRILVTSMRNPELTIPFNARSMSTQTGLNLLILRLLIWSMPLGKFSSLLSGMLRFRG